MTADTPDGAALDWKNNVWFRTLLPPFLIALGLMVAGRALDLPELLRAPDAWFYDLRTALFAPAVKQPRDDVTVVLIDDESLQDGYVSRSPVDRGLQATLVKGLAQEGAKAIGLDFLYDRATSPEADGLLIKALQETKDTPVIMGALDPQWVGGSARSVDQQEKFLAAAGKTPAHIYFARQGAKFTVGDQVIRYWLGPSPFAPHRKGLAHALAEAATHTSIAAPDGGQLIAWQRPPQSGGYDYPFRLLKVRPHQPGAKISDMLYPGWEAYVKGHTVLIGGGFDDIDRHLTPLSTVDHVAVPGVTIHAQILAQLLDGREVLHLWPLAEFALLMAAALLGMTVAQRYGWHSGDFKVWAAGGLGVLLAGVVAYAWFGLIIPSGSLYVAFVAGVWMLHPPRWIMTYVLQIVEGFKRTIGGHI